MATVEAWHVRCGAAMGFRGRRPASIEAGECVASGQSAVGGVVIGRIGLNWFRRHCGLPARGLCLGLMCRIALAVQLEKRRLARHARGGCLMAWHACGD